MTTVPANPARRRGFIWPVVVLGLLALNVTITAALLRAATSDGVPALEPEYYQKALAWDQVQAQMATNQALGWSAEPTVSAEQDAAGLRRVSVTLADRERRPVAGASVVLEAFAHAKAAHRVRSSLRETAPGVYAADLPLDREGLWEVRVTATHEDATFTSRTPEVLIAPARHAPDAGTAD